MRINVLALAVVGALFTSASFALEPSAPVVPEAVVPEFGAAESGAAEAVTAPTMPVAASGVTTVEATADAPLETTTPTEAVPEAPWGAEAPWGTEAPTELFAETMRPVEPAAESALEPLPQGLVFLMAEAQRGSVDAQVLLARALEVGPHKDLKTAFHWWQQAAIAHDHRAELELSHYFAQGRVVGQDLNQALYWLERSALGGNASAQLLMALNYKAGQSCPKSQELAAYWFEQAALSGNGVAQAQIAQCYERGIGVPLDRQKAFYWHQFAATHDANIASKLYVGQALKEASGVSRDYYYAYSWLSEAVAEGEPLAQVLLGNMYAHGQGVAEDDTIAVSLYQQAAAKDNAIAQYQLGLAFYTGKGIAPDRYQAKLYIERACHQGISDACRFASAELEDAPSLIAP